MFTGNKIQEHASLQMNDNPNKLSSQHPLITLVLWNLLYFEDNRLVLEIVVMKVALHQIN